MTNPSCDADPRSHQLEPDVPAGVLRTITIELGDVSGLTGFLAYLVTSDVLCWTRREAGLVGLGEIGRVSTSGPDRFAAAQRWWQQLISSARVDDSVRVPGSGPVAFGSFAFSRTSAYASRLIVPEVIVGSDGTRGWLTQLTMDDDVELTTEGAEAALARLLEQGEPARSEAEERAAGTLGSGTLSEQEWTAAVAEGVRRIQAGELDKLVLARDVVAHLPAPIDTAQVLRELAVRYRECWTYGVDGLIGSTPEMLIKVEGNTARARVLAGTLDRADAPEAGAGYAHEGLTADEKQRHEHQFAIESLTRRLEPFTSTMTAHSEPFVLELPNVWHLASDVSAELTEINGAWPTSLDLAAALHPTAAVCGTPTGAAAELISELEQLDRGPYAGPVGWMDAAGNGEWGIALRGAVVENPETVRLFAGCGIVGASDPRAELAETWAKFRPMLEALAMRS